MGLQEGQLNSPRIITTGAGFSIPRSGMLAFSQIRSQHFTKYAFDNIGPAIDAPLLAERIYSDKGVKM